MQMHIRHETRYRYERPVKYSVQSLHLTPRRDLSQRALSWTITSPGRRLEQVDAHGNISHLLTIEEPHREIQIVVRGVVETIDTEGRQDDGPLSPLAYLAPTPLTSASEPMVALAEFVERDHGAGEQVHESAMAEAVGADRIAVVAVVPLGKTQHALAPRVAVALVAQLFAARTVELDHLLDFALHLGGAFRLGRATGDKQQE